MYSDLILGTTKQFSRANKKTNLFFLHLLIDLI
jgi:hypothetical protein